MPPAQIEAGDDEVEALLEGLKERSATGELALVDVVQEPSAPATPAATAEAPVEAPASQASSDAVSDSAPASSTPTAQAGASASAAAGAGADAAGSAAAVKAPSGKARSTSRDGATKEKGRGLTWLVILLALVGIGGAGAFVVVKQQAGIPIQGLAAGEQLYVNGSRVSGDHIEAAPGAELFISTAASGKLSRFGTVQVGEALDVRNAPEARVAPGQSAQLSVETAASGCTVSLSDGSVKEQGLPLRTQITAANELEVILRCAGEERRNWIMAVPNQAVELRLDPS